MGLVLTQDSLSSSMALPRAPSVMQHHLKWRGVRMAVVVQWGSTVIIFSCDVLVKHCMQSRCFPDAHMCAWWEARSAGRIKPKGKHGCSIVKGDSRGYHPLASKHIPQASCAHRVMNGQATDLGSGRQDCHPICPRNYPLHLPFILDVCTLASTTSFASVAIEHHDA
jgi:hypothetical protein